MLSRKILCIILSGLTQFSCSENDLPVNLGIAQSCDAAISVCEINVGGYSLALELGPDVKPLQPFNTVLKLHSSSKNVQNVVVDFRMIDMDMGMNRYRLSNNGNFWSGSSTLPMCIASRTDWLAVVEFDDEGKRYTASFPFHTDAN